jgi:threonylcarbamoyladenosine tRNA methylthiotransferase MtaB
MTSFSLQNFGCRVNQAEAFLWAEAFQRRGLKLELRPGRGDIVVVNTCTLTGRADRDVRRFIRKVARENPSARLVVTGCLVERARQELEAIPGVWRFISNAQKAILPGLVLDSTEVDLPAQPQAQVRSFKARALLKVQDGCDFRCTFCVIPGVRGRSCSTPPETLMDRLQELAGGGFAEVVLTGIHLCAYGWDLRPRTSLEGLLDRIDQAGFGLRLRLSSLDPRFLDEGLVKALTGSPSVCPHFHLSLQHGSERLLQSMGRKGGAAAHFRILDSLKERSPDAALGADLIVGFPGETEADFMETVELLEHSPLTYAHVFSYSPRPGTAAAAWPQVQPQLKKERAAVLRRISAAKSRAFRRLFLGQEREAAVIKRAGGLLHLLTANYLRLTAPDNGRIKAPLVRVLISEEGDQSLRGVVLD